MPVLEPAKSVAARAAIKEWGRQQAHRHDPPDRMIPAFDGTSTIACWQVGEFRYNSHPIYVTEFGDLIVWETFWRSHAEAPAGVIHVRRVSYMDWVMNLRNEYYDNKPAQYPGLHGVTVPAISLARIAQALPAL